MGFVKLLTVKEVGFYGFLSIIGGAISQLYGGWTSAMTLLVILMISDYCTGILASIKEKGFKSLKSQKSFWGIIRKVLMMLSVLIGHHVDIVMNTNVVMVASIYFWYGNEIISLAENFNRLGVSLPDVLMDKISILKGKKNDSEVKEPEQK